MTDLVLIRRRALSKAMTTAKNYPGNHACGVTAVVVLLEAVLSDLYVQADERELTIAALNERIQELEKVSLPSCVPTIFEPKCGACDD